MSVQVTATPQWALEQIEAVRRKRRKTLDLSREWGAPDSDKLTHLPAEALKLPLPMVRQLSARQADKETSGT